MNIQLTNYGISVLDETSKPLQIKTYELGSSYDYIPEKDAPGVKGSVVHKGYVQDYVVISSNVVKYTIGLDYQVGPFTFGEIAYYDDKGQCVAVAVNEKLITKNSQSNASSGTSLRIDTYLAMVDNQYDMWNDSIGSDIKFQIPVCNSIDLLPQVHLSDPNMFVIPPESENVSSVIAYSAGNGLWNFDCYTFNNVRQRKIVAATETTITIDLAGIPDDAIQDILPNFYGDKIVEFTDSRNYSICRVVSSVTLLDTTAVLVFKTPLANVPLPGDTILYFARTQVSVTDLQIPIASETKVGGIMVGEGLVVSDSGLLSADFPVTSVNTYRGDVQLTALDIPGFALVATSGSYNDLKDVPATFSLKPATASELGGIKVGNNLQATSDGTLSLDFDPVKTINGKKPTADGAVSIAFSDFNVVGLIDPVAIPQNSDLNAYVATGLFYCALYSATILNSPKPTDTSPFSLEVIPADRTGVVTQRWTSGSSVYVRSYNGTSWSLWTAMLNEQTLPIASTEDLGIVQVGNGLSVTDQGLLSANMLSFNGRFGAVEFTKNDLLTQLTPLYNEQDGVPHLTVAPEGVGDSDQELITYARIEKRQLPLGSLLYIGSWNATENIIESDPLQKLSDNGLITLKVYDEETEDPTDNYMTFYAEGYVVRVAGLSDQARLVIDGLEGLANGDLLVAMENKWQVLKDGRQSLLSTDAQGILVSDGTRKPRIRSIISNTKQIDIANGNGVGGSIDINLSEVGTAGTYFKVTTDKWGRVIDAENPTTLAGFGITDAVNKNGDTLTGCLNYDNSITDTLLEQNSLVPKWYVESIAQGIVIYKEVVTCTVENVDGSYTPGDDTQKPGVGATFTSTGTTIINDVELKVNDRILFKDQTDQKQNGIYTVTSIGADTVFTRATDFDGDNLSESYVGATWLVTSGTQFSGTSWTLATPNPTFGTTDIRFNFTAKPSEYKAGPGLNIRANVVSANDGETVKVISNRFEVASGANKGQPLLSGAQGQRAEYGKLNIGTPSNITGILPVANGGTGTSSVGEFVANLLPPATTKSTILYYNGSTWVALAPGKPGSVLTLNDNGDLEWSQTISGGVY